MANEDIPARHCTALRIFANIVAIAHAHRHTNQLNAAEYYLKHAIHAGWCTDTQAAKIKARLEKSLLDNQTLHIRIAELTAEKGALEEKLKLKDSEIALKSMELTCAQERATYAAKAAMQEKVEHAFQRGLDSAHRSMMLMGAGRTAHEPPASARLASRMSAGSMSSQEGDPMF